MPPLLSIDALTSHDSNAATAFTSQTDAPRTISQALVRSSPLSEEHFPIQLSTKSPRNAQIIGRNLDDDGVYTYQLRIGDFPLDDVGVEEILEYVSPYDLEIFENAQFEEERDVLDVVEEQRLFEEAERRDRARMRRAARLESIPGSEDGTDEDDVETGRHGRARPSYKPMFKQLKERRRRKRDPHTGELMPLSEDDEDELVSSSEGQRRATHNRPAVAFDPPKRRRRKRHPVTGELMPLSDHESDLDVSRAGTSRGRQPLAQESHVALIDGGRRRRRRRHPITKELMPLGWRFDSDADSEALVDQQRINVESLQELTVSQEYEAKRMRFDTSSSNARSRSPTVVVRSPARFDNSIQRPSPVRRDIVEILSSEQDSSGNEDSRIDVKPSGQQRAPLIRRSFGGAPTQYRSPKLIPAIPTSAVSMPAKTEHLSSPTVVQANRQITAVTASAANASPLIAKRNGVNQPTTSITHPTAAAQLASLANMDSEESFDDADQGGDHLPSSLSTIKQNVLLAVTTDDDEDDDDDENQSDSDDASSLEDGEFVIETILTHHLSDPRTHPSELGKKSVMLYHVKWEGYDRPTWEPRASFVDESMVLEYEKRVGLA